MKIFVTGSSGLIGSSLVPFLRIHGHEVKRVVRSQQEMAADTVFCDFMNPITLSDWEGIDAVINLAGESISAGRWTEAKKERIMSSRVNSTYFLCQQLIKLKNPPKTLLNGSAIGYYGDRGDEILTEASLSGEGFLAEVCREWEGATQPAEEQGIRVVKLRTSIVLTTKGGALKSLLLPFKLGLGGIIGPGTQYMSWIALDDFLQIVLYLLKDNTIQGPVNISTPYPVTNAEFTKILGRTLHCPTFLPIPAAAIRLLFGEKGDELLLSSTRAVPHLLLEHGYSFLHPELEKALDLFRD